MEWSLRAILAHAAFCVPAAPWSGSPLSKYLRSWCEGCNYPGDRLPLREPGQREAAVPCSTITDVRTALVEPCKRAIG